MPEDASSGARARSPWSCPPPNTFGWDAVLPRSPRGSGAVLTGRGVAYTYRGNTIVATIAEYISSRARMSTRVRCYICYQRVDQPSRAARTRADVEV